jgi:hypothetical protein
MNYNRRIKTQIWKVKERPEYEIECTTHRWSILGPCNNVDCDYHGDFCPICLGTKEGYLATCDVDEKGEPTDYLMARRILQCENFTFYRIQ